MGPIGILVGPMAVAFLQSLLNMLHVEIAALPSQAGGVSAGPQAVPLPVQPPLGPA
jgi:hypothetical protein